MAMFIAAFAAAAADTKFPRGSFELAELDKAKEKADSKASIRDLKTAMRAE